MDQLTIWARYVISCEWDGEKLFSRWLSQRSSNHSSRMFVSVIHMFSQKLFLTDIWWIFFVMAKKSVCGTSRSCCFPIYKCSESGKVTTLSYPFLPTLSLSESLSLSIVSIAKKQIIVFAFVSINYDLECFLFQTFDCSSYHGDECY